MLGCIFFVMTSPNKFRPHIFTYYIFCSRKMYLKFQLTIHDSTTLELQAFNIIFSRFYSFMSKLCAFLSMVKNPIELKRSFLSIEIKKGALQNSLHIMSLVQNDRPTSSLVQPTSAQAAEQSSAKKEKKCIFRRCF